MTADNPRNLAGGAWLIADMALNIWALSIVKALGLDIPAVQLVAIRAGVGFAMMLPWIWRDRAAFGHVPDKGLHLARVALSALTLTASFFAIARVPLALFTAINFTRPLVLMVMAALLLREVIPARRWIAAGIGLLGVLVAVSPGQGSLNLGLAALLLVVISGTGAVILTRRLSATPTVVLMAFYTGGLALLTLPLALLAWTPVDPGLWPALIAIGLFAQSAQFCFLQAHKRAEAGFLAVLGYLSLVFSTSVGVFIFGEVPDVAFFAGAALIVAASAWVALRPGAATRG